MVQNSFFSFLSFFINDSLSSKPSEMSLVSY
uniref:Uncharacterized protein n=1 Tax=Arundo donax TaxID=35708 RepID=A0A0A9G2Q7_ARUDO